MREMGIALATAISAWVNAILLFIILISKRNLDLDRQFFINVFKLGISLFFIIFITQFLSNFFFDQLYLVDIMDNIFYLIITIIFTTFIYVGLILVLKIITITDIKSYLKK
jgi:putative peptidoglycan lipid II flippase